MIGVEVKIEGKKTLIINLYAPNGPKEKFFANLKKRLQENIYKQIVMMGDFNGVVDLKKDKQTQKKTGQKLKGKLLQILYKLIEQEKLCDVWRFKNPKTKDYTFYSNRHATFSRTDMIWATSKILGLTKRIEIIPKIKSDHNPVIWTGYKKKKQIRWRLNEDILLQEEYIEQLKVETNYFF